MSAWTIAFDPVWPWPIAAAVAAALVTAVLLSYRRRLQGIRPVWRRVLFACRVTALLLLVAALFRPAIQFTETSQTTASVMILADASRSMSIADSAGGMTRRQALLKTLHECQKDLKKLGKQVEVAYFDFDSTLRLAEQLAEESDGDQTAIGIVLEELLRRSLRQRVAAAFLLSDGAQRTRPDQNVDPRSLARRLGEQQAPVYTVPFGATGLAEASLDLAIEDLQVDSVVFENKTVPVTAKLRVLGAARRDVTVRLLVEDRSKSGLGESGELKVPPAVAQAVPSIRVQPTQNSEVIPMELSFLAQRPGQFKIAIEAVPLDGELRENNNRAETLLTVRKGGIRVAYFDKVRPEAKAVRLLSRVPDVQLDTYWVRSGLFQGLNAIDPRVFERGGYDIFMIGDVPASVFGSKMLQMLAARIDEGAGLFMIGGVHSFGPGGYAATPLVDSLPVAMSRMEIQKDDRMDPSLHYETALKVEPTTAGLHHYVMRLADPATNQEHWQRLPPLRGANRLKPKNDFVEVLAQASDGTPLLFAHEYGKSRIMAFAADTTYLWLQHGFMDETLRFWQQSIHWLARKEMEGDQTVWVRVEPRSYAQGSVVTVAFGAKDASGSDLQDVDFDVRVLMPDGKTRDLTPQRQGETATATLSETSLPGDYWVTVTANKNGKPLGLDGIGRFLVQSGDLELDNPAADPGLLNDIAVLTGGSAIAPEDLSDFLNRMLDEGIPNLEETRITQATLWDNWWFLALLIAAMSLEWIVRKTRGMV